MKKRAVLCFLTSKEKRKALFVGYGIEILIFVFAGIYSGGGTPDPIPNSAVKPTCGDGIADQL